MKNRTSKIDRKIKRKKKGLIFIFILLLTALFFILSVKTNIFHISSIEVQGNDKIVDEKLILTSGIMAGENIFKTNLKLVSENIKLHPYTKNVKVKRKLPNKIIITIDERKEAAVIHYIGSYIYIDEEGLILNILSEKNDDKVLEINGLEVENPTIGEKVGFSTEEIKVDLFEFINISRDIGLTDLFTSVNIDENYYITIYMDNGSEVAFGTSDDIKYKLNFLLTILKELENKNQSYRAIHLDKGNNAIIIKDKD